MMRYGILILSVGLMCCGLAVWAQNRGREDRDPRAGVNSPGPQRELVRIGVYDSRAVAVAYGRSESFNSQMRELREQHAAAEKAGDKKLAAELTSQGESQQIRMHLQAFSNAPVDEILAGVNDHLPKLAQQRDVVVIVTGTDYRDPAVVEVVDVTEDLVQLFNPDAATLKTIAELRKHKPAPIEQIARMDPRN